VVAIVLGYQGHPGRRGVHPQAKAEQRLNGNLTYYGYTARRWEAHAIVDPIGVSGDSSGVPPGGGPGLTRVVCLISFTYDYR
jgi:hypothetical protein